MRIKVNIIGAGKVGQTLGRLLVQHQLCTVMTVMNRHIDHAKAACVFIGEGDPIAELEKMQPADITFITTPDDAITSTVLQCVSKKLLIPGSVLVHCSGAYASSILAAAKDLNVSIASVHPLKSFAVPAMSCETFNGTYCITEGESEAIAVLTPLLTQIGARILSIRPEHKPLYHSACVFASNYTVTLFNAAWECFVAAGIESAACAEEMTYCLMQDALNNVHALKNTAAALTGPLVRGDTDVLAMHLAALTRHPKIRALYVALAQATIDLI